MQTRQEDSRQKTVMMYRIIEAFIAKHHYPPTLRDIMQSGVSTSTFVTHWHMARLIEWGLLEKKPNSSRAITLNPIASASPEVQKYFEDKS